MEFKEVTGNSNSFSDEEKAEFVERMKKVCRGKGMSLVSVQVQMGHSNGYFRNMGFLSEKAASELRKIIPNVNIEYCNFGKGEPFTKINNDIADVKKVPLLPITAHGGSLTDFEETVMGYQCENVISPFNDADLAITVTGDSMSPEYPNGCKIFIKRIDEKSFVDWGRTFVLDTPNGIVIKNIFPNGSDKIICKSVNPNYPDFEIKKEDVRGWYRVLALMALK